MAIADDADISDRVVKFPYPMPPGDLLRGGSAPPTSSRGSKPVCARRLAPNGPLFVSHALHRIGSQGDGGGGNLGSSAETLPIGSILFAELAVHTLVVCKYSWWLRVCDTLVPMVHVGESGACQITRAQRGL